MEDALLGTFGASAPYGFPAMAGALAFAGLYYAGSRRTRDRRPTFAGFRRVTFPRGVLTHPSSRLDLWLWLMNGFALAWTYGMLSLSLFGWRDAFHGGLQALFGRHAPIACPAPLVFAAATVLQVLTHELAYWLAHYALHRVPVLWEFHKVHHSAKVLTPLTELRQHPVEILLVVNLVGFATGFVFGAMTYAFGPGVRPFTLMNGNILMMAFLFTYGHLHHSNLWIPFTGITGKILHSPAHHQLHHSTSPAHFDRNFGFSLSVWDWAFGTLALAAKVREPIVFGLETDERNFRTLAEACANPVARALGSLRPDRRP